MSAANDFLADIKTARPRWLYLYGTPGVGKTYLIRKLLPAAVKLLKKYEFDPINAAFISWPDIASRLRSGEFSLVGELIALDILALDDIGSDRSIERTDFIPEALLRILNGRLGKWTLITSNRSRAALWELDPRIDSRLDRDGNIALEVNTTDFALRKHTQ